jgi:coenzyme F420-0:L-glutamate ligase/coenzyme F420-1:gamma-L-glutamate ligase
MNIELIPIPYSGRIEAIGLPMLADHCRRHVRSGDVLVVTQKAVSFAEGRVVDLNTITPSLRAIVLSQQIQPDQVNSDPRVIQLVLDECDSVIRTSRTSMFVRMKNGMACIDAGIDVFGVGKDQVCLLPLDSDKSARQLSELLKMPVVISDTQSRFYRSGVVNVAIGSWGLAPIINYIGQTDDFGNQLKRTIIAVADELATAADLVMGKFSGVPFVVVRGYPYIKSDTDSQIINNTQRYSLLDLLQQESSTSEGEEL